MTGGFKEGTLRRAGVAALCAALAVSLAGNAWQRAHSRALETDMQMQRRREMEDIAQAMSAIEVNLGKLLIVAGAAQSVSLLSQTALLAQHVEDGLSRMPLEMQTAQEAIAFTGQMGRYATNLAAKVSGGAMLTGEDEKKISGLRSSCRALGDYLAGGEAELASPLPGEEKTPAPRGLTGARVSRERAREIAARAAGTTPDRVQDAADSGGAFEAFGFLAGAPQGGLYVQITGQGGHVLWMMPEQAEFSAQKDEETCLLAARMWLANMGFGEMEPCYTQEYDGMLVVDFAAVQEGALLYPDQVKVQVSMETGAVVGAECSQYLSNHAPRAGLEPSVSLEAAGDMVSSRLDVEKTRLCVIPSGGGELLCWEFVGVHQGAQYRVYIDAKTGEAAHILRVIQTEQGERAV